MFQTFLFLTQGYESQLWSKFSTAFVVLTPHCSVELVQCELMLQLEVFTEDPRPDPGLFNFVCHTNVSQHVCV